MGYLCTIGSALYTLGNYGLKTGILAGSACKVFYASGLLRISGLLLQNQVIASNSAVDPQTQARIQNTAKSMGIVPHVSCINFGKTFLLEGEAYGANFSWSKPLVACNSATPNFLVCAHELVHIKKNHGLIAETLSATAMLGTAIFSPSLTMTVVAMAVTYLGTKLLYRQFEKEADLGACNFSTAEEISEFIRLLSATIEENKLKRELLHTFPFLHRCLEYIRTTPSGNHLLPLNLTMGLIDPHPPHTTRLHYLKEEYYKKPLQELSIHVSNDARPIRMDPKTSVIVREMIKASKKEDCLLGASHIVLHPNQNEDNLEFCFSKGESATYDVSTEKVQKFMQASVKGKLPLLQQLLTEALKCPMYRSFTIKQEDVPSEQILNAAIEHLKTIPSYDASKIRYKQNGQGVKFIIPIKTS